ncbi:MAG: PTS sugar transporter subunit IIA [Deltaproteobacteria bacterium]|nr:PTS sugar transporter subunit IIA [Deltaproteobacteria bacterium]
MIIPELEAGDKESLIKDLSANLCRSEELQRVGCEAVYNALIAREKLGSTGVGESVAIPHAKISGLSKLVAAFSRSRNGIAFDAIDGQPVRLIFVLLVPENSAGTHLKALARIARLLKNAGFRDRLMNLPDASAIYDAFLEEDTKY